MKTSELMARAKFKKHQDKMVLSLNFANLEIDEAHEIINYSSGTIAKMPNNSVRILTNITDANFNQELISALKEFAKKNKPHVIASAVVGATGIKKVLFNTIFKFSGRKNMKMFNNEDEAIEWLTA